MAPDAPACLITRPEPGGGATAARVAALGWCPVAAPALILSPLSMEPAPGARAALLPSAAAIPALAGAVPPDLPVLAVGEATAAAARAAGFTAVEAAHGDAASLAALATARLDPRAGPLLLAAGRGYGDDLASDLVGRGFAVIRREAYAVAEAPGFPPEARAALSAGQIRAALFLSPRSARVAIALLEAAGLRGAATGIRAVALSGRVAEALTSLKWKGLDVAPRPDHDALLDLLGPAPSPAPRPDQKDRP
ncbi:uroporphyrinogen-III synthase [Pararoseomonas indoligenes]|uniref:Uroporphyrinogen-III synthase n=1 Tax=Roseomonas indoligenes TaxID=2820811 RepID=A0A940MTG4_9PROT|nr:uroporphyrinogen-III synthase [Pararoseomonas indoligenes]MBP0491616.1 uroporphyrinogen-III synthase [Pararoseomonas indoligenes]